MTERVDAETVIDGRYRVLSRLGAGGMAEVYCAQDLQLGRKVALKVLYRRFAADAEFVERFRREASSAAGLQHPHVVSVYDRGEWDGTYYIAMEYLEGRSLKTIVQQEAPLAPARAIDLVVQVLRAARFAHRRGIIHRDLKPHNVIVDDDGRAKVTDFGIARAGASDMTQTGSIMGTAQYLSPEQAQGHSVSAASDLYSVGIILHELLTGRVPFEGESAVTIALKQVNEAPVPPSAYNAAVTPDLDAAVMRALEKDPAHRYADADEFIAVLEAVRSGLPDEAYTVPVAPVPVTVPEPVAVPATFDGYTYPPAPLPLEAAREDRGRWWLWLLGALLLVGAVVAALVLFNGDREVAVPDVVGADRANAEARLRRDGFEVATRTRTSSRPRGEVIGQDPEGGSRAEEGSIVTLTASGGPGEANVPDVVGLTRKSAEGRLERAGFEPRARTATSAAVERGRVISVSPGEGERLEKGSEVTLVVSSGAEQVTVPGVVGRGRVEATATLEDAGFDVTATERESDQPAGTVLAQEPRAGTEADEGSTVTLTVAKAPERVEVPDVAGETQADALATLQDAGFKVRVSDRDVPTEEGDGVVIEQSPSTGEARKGSTVTIVVGRFNPDLAPPAEPAPTTTEPVP